MMHLSEPAFKTGMRRLDGRFTLPKPASLDQLYEYLEHRLTDRMFAEALEKLWAEAHRFPRPYDFIEAAPPYDPYEEEGSLFLPPRRCPVSDPPRIAVRRGSDRHREWQRVLEQRRSHGHTFERDPEGYAVVRAGTMTFRLPVVEVVE